MRKDISKCKTKNTTMKKLLYLLVFISGMAYGQNPVVIAHRGGAGTAPENTLAAFNNAVALNADFFELDVMKSSDDSLMIMHDGTVDRTTDGTGSIETMTYAQLKVLDAGSWYGPEFTGERIPTLWESLMVAKQSSNPIGVVIEIKSSNASVPAAVVAMVQKLNMQDRVLVSSFNLAQITAVKSIDPTIPVQLFGTITNANIDQVVAINGEWVGSGGSLNQSIIDYAHSKGILFNAWTLNSASTMLSAIALGVDGITTDYPQVMLTLLDETEPSDVVLTSATPLETKVMLEWEAASDEESGIAGYDIYRDESPNATTLLISIGNDTVYTDDTFMESQQYYYRIKARNLAGLSSVNYSNEIEVTTLADLTKPVIESISSRGDSTTIVVGFSERIGKVIAETATNYSLNKGATVVAAKLARDLKSVILTTSPLEEQSYLLTVKNIVDRALTPNKMVTSTSIFLHYGIPEAAVAFYKLDSLPFVDPDILVVDETPNENNGMVMGGAFTTDGILGNAIGFDGVDDYVQFAASSSFDINASAVTVSVWTKLPYAPTELPVAYAPLFDSETDNYVLYGDRGNSELRFKVVTSVGAERPGIPSADVKAGEWIMVSGVYDGVNAMVYLNGVLKDSHPLTGTVKTGQVATLGKTGTVFLEGSIDQVEVYSRALSQEELMAMYLGINEEPVSKNPGSVHLNTPSAIENSVSLSWDEAVNYESGIMGYEIYRDTEAEATTHIATVDNVTEYEDNSALENQEYFYRVKAKNTLGLYSDEYSNEVSVTTGEDNTRPRVVYATSRGDNPGIILEFSEMLDPVTAQNAANYTIDQSLTVSDATLALDQKSVILSVAGLTARSYLITLSGIKDLAANAIVPGTKINVTHEGLTSDLVALYKMNDLPVVGIDTILIDESPNANNGIVKMEPALAEGLLGNSVKFDNTKKQFVEFTNTPSFDISDTMVSISVWTKLSYLPIEMPEAYGPLFDSQGDEYVIYADRGNKELRFKVVTNVKAERPGIPNDDLITGQWINVFAVYDGTNAMIYLNGVLKDSHPITGTVKAGTVPMIGKSGTTGTPAFFNGSIDNVAVYKNAFSQEEVMEMYNNYRMKAVFDCESYNLTEDVSICEGDSYTFPDGSTGTETSVHASNLLSVYGCDSVITTNLTVISIDAGVSAEGGVLTANSAEGSYRWLDCDNGNSVISGENGQSFTPSASGNYAVEITVDDCVAISECTYVEIVGVNMATNKEFTVYPNPGKGIFTVKNYEKATDELRLEVINARGEKVMERQLAGEDEFKIDLSGSKSGIYVLRIIGMNNSYHKRIVIL